MFAGYHACLPPAATAIQNRRLILNFGRGRIASISRLDCAEASAVVLTTEGHVGKTYLITGSEAMSQNQLAALYSELSGARVTPVYLSDAMLASVLVAIGTPVTAAWGFMAYGRAVRHGYFDVVDPAFERLTGHPPTPLREVLIARRAELLAVG